MDTGNPHHYSQNNSLQHGVGVEVLQQYMTWEGGDAVLDAGCGTGELCSYISQQPGVASVVGFDLSPDFISYARTNNSSPNVRYHVADAADPSTIKPEWRGAFNKVVSFFVLHWVKDKATALKALNSCLKPGGEIVFVCVSDKSKFHEVPLELSSLPKWSIYLKDAAPALFPWPSSDIMITNEQRSSRLMEACGYEVIACDIKKYPHCYISRDQVRGVLRPTLPHLSYIPDDKQEEFMEDLEKLAAERHWITGKGAPTMHEVYVAIRARKI
ncbi:juvenile hormone acid O-methyltransferase-like [Branchiostoma floridae x Branchiostoma japonicum]